MHMAIGAVVNALWDLKAKRAGQPLWQLLASMTPEELVDLVDFRYLTDALTREEALAHPARRRAGPGRPGGASCCAPGLPGLHHHPGLAGLRRREARPALPGGGRRRLRPDQAQGRRRPRRRPCAGWPSPARPSARTCASRSTPTSAGTSPRPSPGSPSSRPFDLAWIEEPTSPDDVLGHAAIARGVAPVPVATGRAHGQPGHVQAVPAARRRLQVLQIDATRVAGVNENVAILLLAAKFGVPVCPHAGGVGLCEAVQHLAMFDFVAVSGELDGRMIEFVDHLHEHFVTPVEVQARPLPGTARPRGGHRDARRARWPSTRWAAMADRAAAHLPLGPLGFGGANLGNLYRPMSDDDAQAVLDAAWGAGIRHFDTAPHYGLGLSERRLGAFLAGKPRAEYVLSTKVGRLLRPTPERAGRNDDAHGFVVPAASERVWDFSADGVRRSLDESLRRLGLDRVDVLYLHDPTKPVPTSDRAWAPACPRWPGCARPAWSARWASGPSRSTRCSPRPAPGCPTCSWWPAATPCWSSPRRAELLPECRARDIGVVVAGVFNSGLLATATPQPGARYEYADAPPDVVEQAPNGCATVCARHGVQLPVAALQFPLREPTVGRSCWAAAAPSRWSRTWPGCGSRCRRRCGTSWRASGWPGHDRAVPARDAWGEQGLPRRPGPGGHAPDPARRRGARAGRGERRRQVHPDEAALRDLHPGRGRVLPGRAAGVGDRTAPRPGAGHQHHPPGVQPDARPHGRAEHLHRPGTADRRVPAGRAGAQRARPAAHRPAAPAAAAHARWSAG